MMVEEKHEYEVSKEVQEKYCKKNPVWKNYYILNQAFIQQQLSVQEAVKQYLLLAEEMLRKANDVQDKKDMVIGLENLANKLLIFYPEYQDIYEGTIEDELIFSIDDWVAREAKEEEINQIISQLTKRIQLYNQEAP